MRELIQQYRPERIDVVVASHGDADHITGLIPAVALYKPKLFISNGLAPTTQTWAKLVNVVSPAGTQGKKAAGGVINLGSVKATILAPPPGMPQDEQNLNSIGLLVEYGSFRALMSGDSEGPETAAWPKQYPASFNVYKAIHHGSSNGDNAAWLAAVRLQNVVIGVGENSYGHPTSTAMELYRKVGAKVYRTDLNGTVTVEVQPGGRFTVTAEKSTLPPPTAAPHGLPAPPAPSAAPMYPNCAAVRAAGKSPLLQGQPDYRAGLDRDGDGWACE